MSLELIGTAVTAVSILAAIALPIVKWYFSRQRKKAKVLDEAKVHIDNGDTSAIVADLDNLNRM